MLLDLFFLRFSCRYVQDDLPLVHHVAFISQLQCKIQILLDEQDGKACLFIDGADGRANFLDDRRLDAFRRLIKQKKFRMSNERAGNGQLLLLTTGEVPALARQEFLDNREKMEKL